MNDSFFKVSWKPRAAFDIRNEFPSIGKALFIVVGITNSEWRYYKLAISLKIASHWKTVETALVSQNLVSFAVAHDMAVECRRQVLSGLDLPEERERAKKVRQLQQVLNNFPTSCLAMQSN